MRRESSPVAGSNFSGVKIGAKKESEWVRPAYCEIRFDGKEGIRIESLESLRGLKQLIESLGRNG